MATPPKRNSRDVLQFRLKLGATPQGAPVKRLSDYLKAWQDAKSAGTAEREFKDENVIDPKTKSPKVSWIEISLLQANADGSVVILLRYGDVVGTDPALANRVSKRVDTFPHNKDNANGYAAHLVIGPEESRGQFAGTHRCVLEMISKLGRSRVLWFLRDIAESAWRDAGILTYTPTHRPKKNTPAELKEYRPSFRGIIEKSSDLREWMKDGTISGVEFVRPAIRADLPDAGEAKESIHIKVRSGQGGLLARLNLAQRFRDWAAANNFAEVKIDYHGDKQKILSIELDKQDVKDCLFAKSITLSNLGELPQCHNQIHGQLIQRMKSIISDDRQWRSK